MCILCGKPWLLHDLPGGATTSGNAADPAANFISPNAALAASPDGDLGSALDFATNGFTAASTAASSMLGPSKLETNDNDSSLAFSEAADLTDGFAPAGSRSAPTATPGALSAEAHSSIFDSGLDYMAVP